MVAPKLRFKEFDHKWDQLVFSDVFSFYNTNSYSRALLDDKGEIMNIHYGDIHTKFSMLFDVRKEQIPYLGEEIDKKKIREENFLKIGDLVIADASEDYKDIGKAIEVINLDNKKVVAGLHTYIARPTKPCAIGFNGYLMQTANIRSQIQKLATGISVLGISKTNISKIQLCLPSEAEQDKIASFLSAVDEKIAQLSQKHQLLSQYKQGMMQKLFSQQIRFKADDGSEFGEWEDIQLKDISHRITRKNKELNQNALTISAQLGLINQQEYFSKQIASRDLSKYYLLHKGEYAYNKSYSAGYPMGAIKRLKLYDKGVVSTLYICFSLNEYINSDYFEQFVESGLLVPELEKIAQEGARNHGLLNISLQEFFEVNLKMPSLDEQAKIANFLSAIDQKIEVTAQQIEQAKQWKKGLLQQMFV